MDIIVSSTTVVLMAVYIVLWMSYAVSVQEKSIGESDSLLYRLMLHFGLSLSALLCV